MLYAMMRERHSKLDEIIFRALDVKRRVADAVALEIMESLDVTFGSLSLCDVQSTPFRTVIANDAAIQDGVDRAIRTARAAFADGEAWDILPPDEVFSAGWRERFEESCANEEMADD